MEFNEVLRMRQSVRRYTEEKVSAEDIQAILTAAQHAPVGMHNSKGYVLTVISSETVLALMKKNYKEATGKDNDPMYGAPLFLLVSKTPEAIEEIAKYDAACLIENMHLAAAALGLGSVYIHGMIFSIRGIKEWQAAAGLPESTVPLCGLAVGHSVVPLRPRPDEAVFNVTYAE